MRRLTIWALPLGLGGLAAAVVAARSKWPTRIATADAESSAVFRASPEAVWEVLADGYAYAEWVLGTKEIRSVDAGWPEVGSSIHFTAGIGPFTHENITTVRSLDKGRFLELEAHAWPLGTARVAITVEPADHGGMPGTRVVIDEHPWHGPASALHSPISAAGLAIRGRLMLRRLGKKTESAG